MKLVLGYIGAHALYWLGHGVSLLMDRAEWTCPALSPLYQFFMRCSSDVQDWGGAATPWGTELIGSESDDCDGYAERADGS